MSPSIEILLKVLNTSDNAVVVVHQEVPGDLKSLRIIFVNDANEKIVGVKKEAILGKTMFEAFPNVYTDYPKLLEAYQSALDGNTVDMGDLNYSSELANYNTYNCKFIPIEQDHFLMKYTNVTKLRKAEKDIQSYMDELLDVIDEKTLLLKELHHRVKNNLQIIISMLNLELFDSEDVSAEQLFQDCQNRIRSMAKVHEKLTLSNKISSVEACQFLSELLEDLVVSLKNDDQNIKLNVLCSPAEISVEAAIRLSLLVNEVVTNMFKYGFIDRTSGEITLQIRKEDSGEVKIEIGDDGAGTEFDITQESNDSFGLLLVQDLINQLDGEITKLEKPGTFYKISF